MPPALFILTALAYEGRAIAKRLGLSFESSTHASGSIGPWGCIELLVVGPWCEGLSQANRVEGCRGVLMAGLAGALDPALEIGDVVIDGDIGQLLPHPGLQRGAIHTSGEIVATAAAKQALFAATGALVVDMESAVAREFAASRSVPFLGIRAVSDRAADALDPATLDWVDAAGGLRPARLAADLCRRPGTIPDLVRLGIRSRAAVRNLSDAVLYVVRSGWAIDARAPLPSGSNE